MLYTQNHALTHSSLFLLTPGGKSGGVMLHEVMPKAVSVPSDTTFTLKPT